MPPLPAALTIHGDVRTMDPRRPRAEAVAIALGLAAHAVASGWVAGVARGAKGHAAALYLLAYYLGSSVMGSLGGWFWSAGGWPAVSGFVAAMLALSLLASLRIATLPKARGR